MRKYMWLAIAIFLVAGTSCEQKANLEKEKEAIMAVLYEESAAFTSGDKERVFAVHMKDELETRLELGVHGYNAYIGWDKIEALLGDATKAWQADHAVNTKEDVIMKVTGKAAWVACNNVWKSTFEGEDSNFSNVQIVFLEKDKGEWKISFSTYYSKPKLIHDME